MGYYSCYCSFFLFFVFFLQFSLNVISFSADPFFCRCLGFFGLEILFFAPIWQDIIYLRPKQKSQIGNQHQLSKQPVDQYPGATYFVTWPSSKHPISPGKKAGKTTKYQPVHFLSETQFPGEFRWNKSTLLGTNMSLSKAVLKMSFLFPRWDMLIPWRVHLKYIFYHPVLISFDVPPSKFHHLHRPEDSATFGLPHSTAQEW